MRKSDIQDLTSNEIITKLKNQLKNYYCLECKIKKNKHKANLRMFGLNRTESAFRIKMSEHIQSKNDEIAKLKQQLCKLRKHSKQKQVDQLLAENKEYQVQIGKLTSEIVNLQNNFVQMEQRQKVLVDRSAKFVQVQHQLEAQKKKLLMQEEKFLNQLEQRDRKIYSLSMNKIRTHNDLSLQKINNSRLETSILKLLKRQEKLVEKQDLFLYEIGYLLVLKLRYFHCNKTKFMDKM